VRAKRVAKESKAFLSGILQRGLGLVKCQPKLTLDAIAEIADEIDPCFEAALGDLAFKSNKAAFEYACASLRCDVVKGQGLPALVVGATHTSGTAAPVAKDDRGIQTAVLRVASSDGGFPVVALSVGRGPDLNVGDLVAWVPGEYREDLADASADSRFGWVGLIIGTLEPRYVACHPLMCR
jgi:hypothetical protein